MLISKLDAGQLKPRYVRVNTLKMDVDSAVRELEKHYKVHSKLLIKLKETGVLYLLFSSHRMSFNIIRMVLGLVIVAGSSSSIHSPRRFFFHSRVVKEVKIFGCV